ncbi:hypothetical protein LEMLEM_LOCUS16441 [Lemmus lemmus]
MACRFKNLVAVAFLSLPRLPRYRLPGRPPLSPHAAVLRVSLPIRHRGAVYDWLLRFGPGGGAGRSEKLVCWRRRCGSARGSAAGTGEPAGGGGGGDCGVCGARGAIRKRKLLVFEDANSAALRPLLAQVRVKPGKRSQPELAVCGPPRRVLPVWEVVCRRRNGDTPGVHPLTHPGGVPPWDYSKSSFSPIASSSSHALPRIENSAGICKVPT